MIFSANYLRPAFVTETQAHRTLRSGPKGLSAGTWGMPPDKINIGSGEMHVWRAHLDGSADVFSLFADTLSSAELARAAKFKFREDKQRYIRARGILREILGQYISREAGDVCLELGENGKPRLKMLGTNPDLRFSLSHSRGIALYTFTLGHEVGVDLEYIKNDIDVMELAEHVFSDKIKDHLYNLSGIDRINCFYRSWTRIEAYLKARGLGLSIDTRHVNLPDINHAIGENISLDDEENLNERMSIYDLAPTPDFVGSIVVEYNDWQFTHWSWKGLS